MEKEGRREGKGKRTKVSTKSIKKWEGDSKKFKNVFQCSSQTSTQPSRQQMNI